MPRSGTANRPMSEQPRHRPQTEALREAARTRPSRPRILWADPDDRSRSAVARMLGQRYAIETFPDGRSALAAVRKTSPNLVISAADLPSLDGHTLLRVVRLDAALKEMPFVVICAEGDELARTAALEEGADDTIFTPFSDRELLACVAANLKLARVRGELNRALRASEERNRELLQQVKDYAIFSTDAQGRSVTWNEGVENVLGFSADEFIGQDVTDVIFLPEDLAAGVPEQEFATAAREGSAANDRWLRRKDGERFFALGRTTAIRDDRGCVTGFTKVLRDHTSLKRAEENLRESEQRYRTLFESIDEGFCVMQVLFDAAGRPTDYRFLETNRAFEAQTGIVNALGRRMREIAPDHEEHWYEIYGRVVRTGQPVRFQQNARALHRIFDVYAFRVGTPDQARVAALFYDITERKRDEAILRESEHRFREMANTAPGMLWITDERHRCTFLSRGWFEFTGQTEREGLGFGWTDAIHPHDREGVRQRFLTTVEGHQRFEVDYRLRTARGEYRWVMDTGHPRFGPDGRLVGYIGSVIDIHERRQVQDELARVAEQLTLVTNTVPALIAYVDDEQRYQFNNRGYAEWFGYEPDDLRGRHLRDALGDEVYELIRPHVEQTLAGEVASFDEQIPYTSGGTRYIHGQYVPRFRLDGSVAGFYALVTDITSSKQAEEALRRSEARLRAAQQVGGIGTFEWDIRADQNMWSPELEALYGLEPGGFSGTFEAWAALVHPDDLARARDDVQRSLETGDFESEWRVQLPDGETRWLEARGWVERGAQGEPLRMIGVNLDITERKRHDEHLRTVMAELNHRVKNTLATIDAIAHQMLHQADNLQAFGEAFRPRLRSMAAAHSLLTRSEWSGADLRDILLTELKARVASLEHLVLAGPAVLIKPKAALALHMAIHELATNASKYGALSVPAGRVRVSWEAGVRRGEPWLELTWKEQDGPAVAEPPAAGFGSQMVSDVIEYELDGTVERHFESDGLRCRIAFSLAGTGRVLDDAPAPAAPAAEPSGGPPRTPLERPPLALRVLVVEDNHTIARTLCAALAAAGCTVVGPAGSLEKAQALAENEPFDAAILDVDLSGAKVYPLARRLRQREIPYALLTGFGAEDLAPDLRAGPVFGKPADVDGLRAWLADLA